MLSRRSNVFIWILIFSLLAWSCKTLSDGSDDARVTNVQYTQVQDSVIIYYNLLSKTSNQEYYVHLYLSIDGGNNFNLHPESVTGSVGNDITPGYHKRIVWDVLKDYPQGLKGDNYQFLVRAQPQTSAVTDKTGDKHSGLLSYVLIGGLVGLAGTAVGILIGRSSGQGIPAPPARPAQ